MPHPLFNVLKLSLLISDPDIQDRFHVCIKNKVMFLIIRGKWNQMKTEKRCAMH